MVNRIQEILKRYDLSSSKFADQLDVPRSTISHILSERNKPSLEFIQKVLDNYPDININWLLKGEGNIFGKERDLFSDVENDENEIQPNIDGPTKKVFPDESNLNKPSLKDIGKDSNLSKEYSTVKEEKISDNQSLKPSISAKVKKQKIIRIIAFYEDNTFDEYFPTQLDH